MSDFEDLQRIFENQQQGPVWDRLTPLVGGSSEVGRSLEFVGLQITFVFNDEGQLLGGYNWKE